MSQPDEPTLWVTTEQAGLWTGQTYEDSDLYMAQSVIEAYANVSFDDTDISLRPRDLKNLAKAVAYQALFMKFNPGLFANKSLSQLTQNSMSANFTTQAAVILSPVSMRCIQNLTWRQITTVHTERMRTRAYNGERNFTNESSDEYGSPWKPLPTP